MTANGSNEKNKLAEGDLIDRRYVVEYAGRIGHYNHHSEYVLFDRHTGDWLYLSWSQLRKMFVGRDNEPKAEKV